MSKKKYEKVIATPTSTAHFPYLNQPDEFKGQVLYKTGLVLDPTDPEHADFMKKLEDLLALRTKEWLESDGKKFKKSYTTNDLFKAQLDADGTPTGLAVVNCKSNNAPAFLDSRKKQINGIKPMVYGGAEIKVAVQPKFYDMPGESKKVNGLAVPTKKVGLTLYLQAVMIINLNSRSSAEAFGDVDVEDGFEYDPSAFTEDTQDSEDSHDSDDF